VGVGYQIHLLKIGGLRLIDRFSWLDFKNASLLFGLLLIVLLKGYLIILFFDLGFELAELLCKGECSSSQLTLRSNVRFWPILFGYYLANIAF
jgi:hypothetical protein